MKRRTLLSLLPAGCAIAASTKAAPLKIGQIGTAHAHAGGKLTSIRSLPEIWQLIGIAEPDAALKSRAEKSATYSKLNWMREEDLLQQPGLTTVAIETSIEASASTAMRCLQAGKHIHLDKPGALTLGEFRTMRLEAEKRQLTVQMGYMLRYNPAFELLFQAVKQGWLGEITQIDAAMGKLADPGTRAKIRALPGGGFFELACHLVDAVVTLLGRPKEVIALSTPTEDPQTQDNQIAILSYSKATALLRCNHADPFGSAKRHFSVTGTLGSLHIQPLESGQVQLSLTQAASTYAKGTHHLELTPPKDRYVREFEDLAKVVRGEKALAWSAQHDVTVFETVLKASGLPS